MLSRLSVVSIVVLACRCVVPLAGQQTPPLDRPLLGEVRIPDPRAVSPCATGVAVDHLARAAHVFFGFENLPNCPPSTRTLRAGEGALTFSGLTVRQAFDRVLAEMPQFAWKERDGVVVIRPRAAWTDASNLLNQPVQAFEVADLRADDALHVLLQAGSLLWPHQDVARSGVLVDARLSMTFRGGSLMEALNAFVRAHGGAVWDVGYPGHAMVVVHTLDFPGDGIMAPAGLPQRSSQ